MPDSLPVPCPKCAPDGGNWLWSEDGMRRCSCERGRMLAAGSQTSRKIQTVLKDSEAMAAAALMGSIPGFPFPGPERAPIAQALRDMCVSFESAAWLASRMVNLYRRWPGVPELRVVYCSQYRPLDGQEADGSETFPDGVPALPPGQVSSDRLLDSGLKGLAKAKGIQRR